MEPEIKIGDLSPWHHLIFVEELADDVRDEAKCKLCSEQAVGPVYKCLECDFIQHKSCPNPTVRHWELMMKFCHSYNGWKRHHLMLVEEVENRAEEEVVCSECQEIAFLPAFKCAIPGCSFLLHKSCAELSSLAVLHPQHSDHVLTLQPIDPMMGAWGEAKRCNGCNKLIECLYYGCRRCNVYLHPKCSAPETELELEPQPEPRDRSPWHHLIFVEEVADDISNKAYCMMCWKKVVGPVYRCLECDFIQHKSCSNPTQRNWKERMKYNHYQCQMRKHHLMLVEEVENRAEEGVVCWGCQEPPSLPAYRCSNPGCSFLLDKSCTELSLAVLHPQHSDHVLTLQELFTLLPKEFRMGSRGKDKRCNACKKLIKYLDYGCRRCNVYLHPKCSTPEMELELEPLPLREDLSPWHHLIFVEELAYKDECAVCKEQAVGTVYKCLECDFIQHKSCPKPTTRNWEKRMENHYDQWRHHLMLVEEVENRAEEEVVCWGCQQPPSLPGYKCALPGCIFLLHKSCTEESHAVLNPLYSDHVLTIQTENLIHPNLRTKNIKCIACAKTITMKSFLFYGCAPCDYYLHKKCLSHYPFSADDFHEHTVVVATRVDRFTCQACGEECKDLAYICIVCRLIMERDCADFPHSIRTTLHGPSLIFIRSVRLINKENRVLCRFCRKQVNTRYGAYYCIRKCGYILHLKCARRFEDKDSTTESGSGSCEEHTIYLLDWSRATEDERVDEKFKHFDHPQHELTLSHEEPGYDKKCKACMHFLFFAPYYGCVECNFFLHVRCAKLPRNIRRGLLHEHPLTLTTFLLGCCVCKEEDRTRYGYVCDKCDEFGLDVKCGLLPESLEHVLHEHILFLVRESERPEERCNVCGTGSGGSVGSVCYVCTDCEFRLCGRCVAFPPTVRYRYHPHHLTVTFTNEDQEENYCLICEKKIYIKNIFYWCEKCDFTIHSNCILEDPYDSSDYDSLDYDSSDYDSSDSDSPRF